MRSTTRSASRSVGEYLSYLNAGHAIEGTVTLGYSPVKNCELRAELRYDKLSDGLVNSGLAYTRALATETTDAVDANNNTEFALQGVYKFSLP